MNDSLTVVVGLGALPVSVLAGGGLAYLRCMRRGEVQAYDVAQVMAELQRQADRAEPH